MAELYRTYLEEYSAKYKDFFKFRRENGILEVRFHTNDGPLKWGLEAHRAIIPAMADINDDPENECMILTGTGDSFLTDFDQESWSKNKFFEEFKSFQAYDIFYRDQTREPMALINLQIPVVAAINGPICFHAEVALLNDIVICSENVYFYEDHWDKVGVVPGDGVHTLYRELLGPNRARYFLYMDQKISAQEALQLGLVGEVVPRDKLLDRAWEIAEKTFMSKNRIQRRLARALLIQPWKELFAKELSSGMAHESLACCCYWSLSDKKG
jgi:enoyl-CoA hydratase/carnithine racemase